MTTFCEDAAPPDRGARPGEGRASHEASRALRTTPISDLDTFQVLLGYAPYGGAVSGNELAALLRCTTDQPLSLLARWLVGRSLISIPWLGQTYIPIFQLDMTDMSLHPSVRLVLFELAHVFEPVAVAMWFIQPNPLLAGLAPARALARDPGAVLFAARRERYVSGY